MRASTLLGLGSGGGSAGLLASLLLASGALAAEYHQHTPRDGRGPLPLSQLYFHPVKGKSTYYGNYVGGGSCGLDQPNGSAIPKEIQGIDWTVALDREQFFQGGCGMCIELRGKGKGSGGDPVKGVYHVFVNNLCPECEYGHLDVAKPGDGLWDITWKAVPCDVGQNNMRFVFMGSNDYYLKLSTQGSRFPTKRLRLKLDGQQWVDGAPVHGSYFEFRDGAPFRFPIEVEVTSIMDEVLTDWIPSIEGGPSHIQYRREEPTDAQIDEAEPGEEPEADDDIEQPSDPAPAPAPASSAVTTPAPSPGPFPGAVPKKAAPKYEALSFAEAAEAAEYRYRPLAEWEDEEEEQRRRPFLYQEDDAADEAEEEAAARWETQYLRGRVPRSE